MGAMPLASIRGFEGGKVHTNRYHVKARVPNESGGYHVWTLARNARKEDIGRVVERARLSCRGLEAWRVPERREAEIGSK
jgi:hypothetical protein